jgi:excisionase family DNA binding protein
MTMAAPSLVRDVLSGTRHRPVTIKEACTLLGVSRRSIYNWLAKGKLEIIRTPGGAVRIFPDSLLRVAETSPVLVARAAASEADRG